MPTILLMENSSSPTTRNCPGPTHALYKKARASPIRGSHNKLSGKNMPKVGLMLLLVSMLVAAVPRHVNAAITCEEVTYYLIPCIGYGVFGGTVAPSCCTGIKTLDAAAKTTEDRREKCNCVKEGAARIPGLNYTRVNEIPGLRGTTCPYKVTPDVDCSKVN
ncbi:PREDICTED: non-specific lipid-transfer protein 1 [Theobroma cacao]|uniref:Non-specific lipid-transfer protein n=2 Tax=Theobroma cacao TaxID=3641 RepID=A0AB32UTX1_THECC|nr:PREDICTED: non-specific lipid-transfer protein 1 [Theobroma cacao]EOY34699.1 Bifunctional inhibitor/lipid-transfer protein/seed storage 2S albumin superfamily protein, putative [Theobroma cacao]